LVALNYTTTRTASQYADWIAIPLKELNKICHSYTGKTAKVFIIDYITLEAKRWLVTTRLPVKRIAYECGFSEPTNFLKFFKKNTGITPSKFRVSKV